ncbi:hypothetical protein ACFLWU_06390 [Chloroflexota bacterium]
MENAAIILLYIGTILIGAEYVGNMGYISTIVVLPLSRGIKRLFERLMSPTKESNKLKAGFEIFSLTLLFLLWVLIILIAALVLSPFLIIQFIIGMPLLRLNNWLNKLKLISMEDWKDTYYQGVRAKIKGKQTNIKPTDENLWRVAEQSRVPFLALFGVVCVTIGFIFQLLK